MLCRRFALCLLALVSFGALLASFGSVSAPLAQVTARSPEYFADCPKGQADLGCGCGNPANAGCGCGNPAPDPDCGCDGSLNACRNCFGDLSCLNTATPTLTPTHTPTNTPTKTPTATASSTQTPTIAQRCPNSMRVGIEFEDDKDYNFKDYMMCFCGNFSVSGSTVTSTANQTVTTVSYGWSCCNQGTTISVMGLGGNVINSIQFNHISYQQEIHDLSFPKNSYLRLQITPYQGDCRTSCQTRNQTQDMRINTNRFRITTGSCPFKLPGE